MRKQAWNLFCFVLKRVIWNLMFRCNWLIWLISVSVPHVFTPAGVDSTDFMALNLHLFHISLPWMSAWLWMQALLVNKGTQTRWSIARRVDEGRVSKEYEFSDLMPLAWSWHVQPAVCAILNAIMEVTGCTHNAHWAEGKARIDDHAWRSSVNFSLFLLIASVFHQVPFLRTYSYTKHTVYHLLQNLSSMCVCRRRAQDKETAPGVVMPPECV